MLHLVESRIVERHIPRLLGSITSITGRIARLQHLHDGIMTIGMAAGTGKDTPVGIAANVIILPALLVRIVQALRNILVARFGIEHRFDRLVCPGRIHIHPVVLLGIVRDRIILITHTLTILAMTTLEGMEIEPFRLAPPFGRSISATRMIGHEMIVIDALDAGSERLPHLWVDITLDIATHHPDDIRRILIAVGKELSVCLSLLCIDILCLYLRTPDGYHADVDAVHLGKFDDVVEMIPIAVDTCRVCL